MDKYDLLDSLTDDQRKSIASLIRSTPIDIDWIETDDDAFCCGDTEETLRKLAGLFESHEYEPEPGDDPPCPSCGRPPLPRD